MVARIQIACEESNHFRGINCGYIDVEIPDTLIADVNQAVTEAGWTHDHNGYHCPRHNPDNRWLRVRLSSDQDIEPIPGIRIRLSPADENRVVIDAELLLDPNRYDVKEYGEGQLEAAKHVNEEWPT